MAKKKKEIIGHSNDFTIVITGDLKIKLANWCWNCTESTGYGGEDAPVIPKEPDSTWVDENGVCEHCSGTRIQLTESGEKIKNLMKRLENT